ncbi:hypothetical protein MFIFM68171_03119 [Madurella fahalii]|uniref:Uncharacterized protein n=1 Tax=Madurella fahalii TaxID=1157608 RepID=A0ABQ0G5B1_9PEZI
MALWASSTHSE